MQNLLFYRNGNLIDKLDSIKYEIKSEIVNLDRNYLLNVSETDLIDSLLNKYTIKPIIINEENKYIHNDTEVDIDVSNDPERMIMNDEKPVYIKGISINIAIPYEGDGWLFQYIPSTRSFNPPRGEIREQKIHLTYEMVEHDSNKLKELILNDMNKINKYSQWIKKDAENFNNSLEQSIKEIINWRKEKLLKDLNLVKSLGIPIEQRNNLPETYVIPEIKRKPQIKLPEATTEQFKPEPTLDMKNYEHILKILQNMVLVMERSPSSFANMKEEDLRMHFLVHLNGHYEGLATGETFNYEGKTDILIRYEGKNVFIAECMFWEGKKSLLDKIDQLLSYLSWRDTKTAILVFNRRKNFSEVLIKIPEAVTQHKCFKCELEKKSETISKYIFHQPEDANKEVYLTIMAFNVPKKENI